MVKRILVTATTFPRWKDDTEPKFVYDLSVLLAKKGHKITVLVPHYYKAKVNEIMGGLRVFRFRYFFPKLEKLCYDGGILPNMKKYTIAKILPPFLSIAGLLSTIYRVKKDKIEVIHAHWILPEGFTAYLVKKVFKVPYVVTVHAGDIFPLKNKIFRYLAKLTLKNADYCTANSNYTKSEICKIWNSKDIKIIPMGVDLKRFNPNKKRDELKKELEIKDRFILSVGRLAEKKGIKYLILALPIVLKKFPKLKLVIIGDGPEKEKLMNLVKEVKLEKNILFANKLINNKLPEYYATADLFVGPSIVTLSGDTEGLGVVFLEALASETPVIGSNVGGIPDIIKDGKTGLLVEQKNSEKLAETIIYALSNYEESKSLAKNGREYIKARYSWENVSNKFDEIF
ncbi:glycosyltransferase family 4 protein [Candidatus Woesearchaeota archaeon]|nr:glycosyltransferase family 4 protein [Candidatus Woesearchaeota archaeon]